VGRPVWIAAEVSYTPSTEDFKIAGPWLDLSGPYDETTAAKT